MKTTDCKPRLGAPVLRHSGTCRGFTLIELLASIAVLAVLMGIVFSIYDQVAKAWTIGERRVEAFQNIRLVLDTMGRELEGAIASSNTVSGKAITFLNFDNASSIPSSPSGVVATSPNDQLFWAYSAADTMNTGDMDLSECGYFVGYCNDASGGFQTMKSGAYYLIRHFSRSSGSGFNIFSNPTDWPSTPIFTTSTKTPILDNVIRLQFYFEKVDGSQPSGTIICRTWNTTGNNGGCADAADSLYTDPKTMLPRAVHVRMAMLDRRHAAALTGLMTAKSWTTGVPSGDLAKILPSGCSGKDLDINNMSDVVLQNIMRDGVHLFYKTIYLCNATN